MDNQEAPKRSVLFAALLMSVFVAGVLNAEPAAPEATQSSVSSGTETEKNSPDAVTPPAELPVAPPESAKELPTPATISEQAQTTKTAEADDDGVAQVEWTIIKDPSDRKTGPTGPTPPLPRMETPTPAVLPPSFATRRQPVTQHRCHQRHQHHLQRHLQRHLQHRLQRQHQAQSNQWLYWQRCARCHGPLAPWQVNTLFRSRPWFGHYPPPYWRTPSQYTGRSWSWR